MLVAYVRLLVRSIVVLAMSDEEHPKEPNSPASSSKPTRREETEQEEKFGSFSMNQLRQLFARGLSLVSKKPAEKVLDDVTIQAVAKFINSEKCHRILILTGAGISTSAGIPDFRSPGSGLYDNLKKYDLPYPEAIFDINYFRSNPKPFFALAKELYPGSFKPTKSHYFIKLMNDKSLLQRIYTQNIDGLERIAGIEPEKIVEAHGTFHVSHCVGCRKEYELSWMKNKIFADEIPTCTNCQNTVKPDIVFFGENLPSRFFELQSKDFPSCDLLIVMGSSLVVQPFASLVSRVPDNTPRLLINKEKAGDADPMMSLFGSGGMDFDSENNVRDVAWLGLCDEGCQELADLLGWGDELKELVKKEHDRIDEETTAAATPLDKAEATGQQGQE